MTTFIKSTTRRAGPLGHVRSGLSRAAAAVTAARLRRRTFRSLSSLDDRALKDIGLHRSMIPSVSFHDIRSLDDIRSLEEAASRLKSTL